MSDAEHDPVLTTLAELDVPAPAGMAQRIFTGWLAAPSVLGEVYVAVSDRGVQFLRSAAFVNDDPETFAELYRDRFDRPLRPLQHPPTGLPAALRGRRAAPALDLAMLSPFHRAVLTATREIPAGETRSYSWVAREAGRPNAVRAAASALARNPVPLLVPCHRVTRTGGGVGQYLFGPATKRRLLREEGVDPTPNARLAARTADEPDPE